MKEAAAQNWDRDLEQRAHEVLLEADADHRRFQELLQEAEDQMRREGFDVPDASDGRAPAEARWWREELTPDCIAPTGDIEDALSEGLDRLLSRVPTRLWAEQRNLHKDQYDGIRRQPLILSGGIPIGRSPEGLQRYVYALVLAHDFLTKCGSYEPFEGALLVPSVAALAANFESLAEVKGGFQKLDELFTAPNNEVDSRVYELLVAGRAAKMGRGVEFIFPVAEKASDLRIHGLPFPAVVECKMQSRMAQEERDELIRMQEAVELILAARQTAHLPGILDIFFSVPVSTLRTEEIVSTVLDCIESLAPYRSVERPWGTISLAHLEPSRRLARSTPLFSPYFLKEVYGWSTPLGDYDGIGASVANRNQLIVQDAKFPFCIRWRTDFRQSVERKARHVVGLIKEAVDQIPVGEAGFIYLAYEDTHRAAIANLRTERIRAAMSDFYITKRGVLPIRIVINRLHPEAIGDGRPDLIESCIPLSEDRDDPFADWLPTNVYVPNP